MSCRDFLATETEIREMERERYQTITTVLDYSFPLRIPNTQGALLRAYSRNEARVNSIREFLTERLPRRFTYT